MPQPGGSTRRIARSRPAERLTTDPRVAGEGTRCFSRHSVSDGATEPGVQEERSRWMTGKLVLAARAPASVLVPDPARPVITTRRPSANRGPLVAALSPHLEAQ